MNPTEPNNHNEFQLAVDLREHENLTIGILSDTHGILNKDIAQFIKGCDIALHAGDVMGIAPLAGLQPKLGKVFAVKGNNDLASIWDADEQTILDEIPDSVTLTLAGGVLVMEHGHRVWDRETKIIHQRLRERHPDAQLVVYGHTHIRTVDDSASPMLVNPGAAGEVRVHDGPSCIELTVSAEKWELKEHLFPLSE